MNKKLMNALLCALLAGTSVSIYAGDYADESCPSGVCGENMDDMDGEMVDQGMQSRLEEEETMPDDDLDFDFGMPDSNSESE
jgi:hypothetical protein